MVKEIEEIEQNSLNTKKPRRDPWFFCIFIADKLIYSFLNDIFIKT